MDELMGKTCSYFYPRPTLGSLSEKKALFGGYPTQEQVYLLESIGVEWFVDLTLGNEKRTTPYIIQNKEKYITFPIMDQRVPDNIIEFVKFINKLVNIISGLTNCEKLYIHCKGGHGRSGLIAATLLCVMDEISPEKAIKETTLSHNQRHMMKKKWKKIGSPQTKAQCNFLHYLFGSQNINNDSLLSPYSHHPVIIVCDKTEIVFKSASDAVHYLLHNSGKSDYHCIEFVLDNKFQQHPSCKQQLLQTGFRQLQCRLGKNYIGTICIKLRNKYYKNLA